MRRSAAPSAFGVTKKPRFIVPYASSPVVVDDKENACLPKNLTEPDDIIARGNGSAASRGIQSTRSTEDVLKLLANPCVSESGEIEDSDPSACVDSESEGTSNLNNTGTPFLNEQHKIHSGNERLITKSDVNSITKSFQQKISPCTGSGDDKCLTPAKDSQGNALYYGVVWCKRSMKKHKKWEGDAILIIEGRSAMLKDMEGKEIGRGMGYKSKEVNDLEEGSTFYVGGKECEIQNQISTQDYMSGKCFQVLGDNSSPAPHCDSKML